MTVRAINRLVLFGQHHVVARYVLGGITHQGRITRARLREGRMEGKTLTTGQWVVIQEAWQA